MDTTTTPAAPAPDIAPTIPADRAAANAGDFSAFQDARRAEREGKPLAAVEVAELEPVAPLENRKTRAQKEQDRINESIRSAIDAATSPLKAEIARLSSGRSETPAPAEPAPAPKTPEWKRFAAMADAPKLTDKNPDGSDVYASLEEHTAAMSYFIGKTMLAEQQQESQTRTADSSRADALNRQGAAFGERLAKAKAADPDLDSKIPPALATARPLSAGFEVNAQGQFLNRHTGESAKFANFVAETLFQSDDPGAFITHIHAHPEDMSRIGQLPPQDWMLALARLDGRVGGTPSADQSPAPARADAETPTISTAPAPAPIISRPSSTADPKTRALATGNVDDFLKIRRQERRARLNA